MVNICSVLLNRFMSQPLFSCSITFNNLCFSGEKHTVHSKFSSVSSWKSRQCLLVDNLRLNGDKFIMCPVSGVDMVLSEKDKHL